MNNIKKKCLFIEIEYSLDDEECKSHMVELDFDPSVIFMDKSIQTSIIKSLLVKYFDDNEVEVDKSETVDVLLAYVQYKDEQIDLYVRLNWLIGEYLDI